MARLEEEWPAGTRVTIRRLAGARPQPDDGLEGTALYSGEMFVWVEVEGMGGGPRPYWPEELERMEA